MTHRRRKTLAGLAGLWLVFAPVGTWAADSDESPPSEPESSKSRLWSPPPKDEWPMGVRTSKWVGDAYTMIADENFDGARAALDNLRVPALNPLERATVFQATAYIAYGEEDLPQAVEYLQKAIDEKSMGHRREQDLLFQIARLHLAQEQWQQVVEKLTLWFSKEEKPNSSAYYLLALAHFQMEDFDAALPPASKSVEMASEPVESWLQLLLAVRLTRKEYKESVPIIEELIRAYPKKDYWVQLSTVHGALGDFEEALVPLQLAYEQKLLTEDGELRRLGQLLLYLELPYRAARVLNEGLEQEKIEADTDVYEMLSNAWIAAREFEKAVPPLEKAAEMSDKGDIYIRLAQVQLQREKWGGAIDALERAIEKGELKNPGDAHLLMGIARYSRSQPRQAMSAFERAREFEGTRDEASNWILHIERELSQAS